MQKKKKNNSLGLLMNLSELQSQTHSFEMLQVAMRSYVKSD